MLVSTRNNGVAALRYGVMVARVAGWKVALILLAVVGVIFLAAPFILFFGNNTDIGGEISDVGANQIPKEFIPIYQAAAKKYGVPWNLLAAHHKVETDFSRNVARSVTGALGPMQFEPCTWVGWGYPYCTRLGDLSKPIDITNPANIKKYGGYGVDGDGDGKADPMNVADAIFSAAHYLAANGAGKGNVEEAVFAYNHDPAYVAKVMRYAQAFVKPQSQPVTGKGGFVLPIPQAYVKNITSPFGLRYHPIQHVYKMHEGTDFGVPQGTPVFTAAGGKVVYSGVMGGYGNIIIIDHGHGIETRYGHLSQRLVHVGEEVSPGQEIARSGNTGMSTGAHLHFEVRINDRPTDPIEFLKK